MGRQGPPRKGRGAGSNPGSRFSPLSHEPIDDGWGSEDPEPPRLATQVAHDASRSVIAWNRSPDLPFDRSINPYRGCEHGCIYCYARPSHAYLDLSPGLDFESRLIAKPDAARLLEAELARPGYECKTMALGTNTDPYQPIEKRYGITRQILEVLAATHHPVAIVTKSALVERDIDLLAPMAEHSLASVTVSVTSLDRGLMRRLEPRAAAPGRRLRTLHALTEAGIPAGVLVAPVMPVLNDGEIERVVEACAEAGARWAAHILLRLPHEVKDLFVDWLEHHYPLKAAHVMSRVRETRGGRENDPQFGTRLTGTGDYAAMIAKRFEVARRRCGLDGDDTTLDTTQFRPPARAGQLALF